MKAWLIPGFPDCRLTGSNKSREHVMTLGAMAFERVFCANCGADGGAVPKCNVPHVFYLCRACAETHGGIGLPELPEDIVRSQPIPR